MLNKHSISVIMPVHNGATTLRRTLASLLAQTERFDELIIVDDGSTDGSAREIKGFLDGKREYKFLKNKNCRGLAATYNQAIKVSSGDLIVTLHQDILFEKDALERLIGPFSSEKVVASTHVVSHPMEIWQQYNFWQKCFFARLAGKDFSGIDGKFDCFRRSALEKVGLFDEKHFRSAGEDGDIVFKLKKIGSIAMTEAKIIHLHKIDPNFNWKDIIRKQAQYSEAQGALLARGRILNFQAFIRSFFREILLFALFVPYVRILALILILIYSFAYTKLVFQNEYRNKRIFILPFFNILLLFVSSIFSLKGTIYGKQKI